MTELNLDGNLFRNIDSTFVELKLLTTLNLANNLICALSNETFHELNNLQKINLSSNFLTSLNGSLKKFKTLSSIDLSHNRIDDSQNQFELKKRFLDGELFLRNTTKELIKSLVLGGMETLDLSFNNLIGDVDLAVFFNEIKSSLKRLYLRNVGLTHNLTDISSKLKELQTLDLSGNL